jgi:hypothetical protein
MQKISFLFLFLANSFFCSYSQSVGIGTSSPNASAKLDIVATNQGLLPPRLTYTQRNNIVNPAAGLMIWCSTCGTNGELQVYNGSSWQSMMNGVASDSLDAVLTSSLSSLPSFDFVNVSSSSTSKSFTVSGIGLVNRPGIITIKSQNSEFQVSNDNISWDTTTSIVYNSSVLSPTLVYVRFSPQSIGSKTGIINIKGGGANEVSVSVSGTGINSSRITIAQLRAMYTTNMKITTTSYISGVVTSDAVNKNIGTGSAIIQDESGAAVIVYFGGTVFYNLGDSIFLDITNDSLVNYRGSLEIKLATGSTAPLPIATGKVVIPIVKTIAEVNAAIGLPLGNPGNFESSLIKILNASATGNTTFYGNNTLTDGSGSITLYTATAALFSGNQLPIGSLNWIGQAKNYAGITKEFLIRNTNDVGYSNYVYPPSIASTQLSDFGNVIQLTKSTSQSFTLSGSYLTGAPGTITVTAPSTDFQVSNDNITWGSTTSVSYDSDILPSTLVYVRFSPQTEGFKNGNIEISGGGIATQITVSVSGTGVFVLNPTLSASTLSDFGNVIQLTNSRSLSFSLSGSNLTGAPGTITVTAPSTDFQVSNDNINWGATTNVNFDSETLPSTLVYVRFSPQSEGFKNGNIEITGGGIATPITVSVSGTGVDVNPTTSTIVISQLFGGGSNTGAPYNADYVELHNNGSTAQTITNYSVQYYSPTGTLTWSGKAKIPTATIPAGGYYLVQMSAAGVTNGVALPTPDYVANPTISMSSINGRVALVKDTFALTACTITSSVVDLVGYGTAICYEGSAAVPALSPTTAAFRINNGCYDTNNNSSDFTTGTPAPRNSASPVNICTIGRMTTQNNKQSIKNNTQ